MKASRYDVLTIVHYSYDPHNAYYEVFCVEAVSADSAKQQVERYSRSQGWRGDRNIVSMRVLYATTDGSLFNFVGKRVGQFIEDVLCK